MRKVRATLAVLIATAVGLLTLETLLMQRVTLMSRLEARPIATSSAPHSPFNVGKVHVITLADDPTRTAICPLAASVYSQGLVLGVLGWNYSDHFFDGTSCGPPCQANRGKDNRIGQQKKLHWLHHYFEHHPNLHGDDLVLFTDAWDVIVNGDMATLTSTFLKQTRGQRGVIFNGEPSCGDSFGIANPYGDKLRSKRWPIRLERSQKVRNVSGHDMCYAVAAKTMTSTPTAGPNWSLGSGGILGDVASIRAFLRGVHQVRREQEDEYSANPSASFLFQGDQILFQLAYVRFPDVNALVDTRAEIFFVLSYNVGDDDFAHYSVPRGCAPEYLAGNVGSAFTFNNVTPVFLHFPGSHKRHLDKCFQHVARARAHLHPQQYFVDIDANRHIFVHDLCDNYS